MHTHANNHDNDYMIIITTTTTTTTTTTEPHYFHETSKANSTDFVTQKRCSWRYCP